MPTQPVFWDAGQQNARVRPYFQVVPDRKVRRVIPESDHKVDMLMRVLDDRAKLVTSRLGADRFRVAGTAELNGFNRDIRADRIAPLVEWTRRYFPDVSTARVIPWSGLRPMLPSMLPKVGQGRRPGVFYNTGHGHLGWTLSAATAELVAEAVLRKWPGKPVQVAAAPSASMARSEALL